MSDVVVAQTGGWFLNFIGRNNIVRYALAAIISERISEITSGFVEHIVMPIINTDLNNNGIRDIDEIKKLEDREIEIRGIKFKLGKVVFSIIKFIVVVFLIFIISGAIRKFVDLDNLSQ